MPTAIPKDIKQSQGEALEIENAAGRIKLKTVKDKGLFPIDLAFFVTRMLF